MKMPNSDRAKGRPAKAVAHATWRLPLLIAALGACAVFAGASSVRAAAITLNANDGFGKSSFDTQADSGGLSSSNWSDGQFPTSANTYTVAGGLSLRTPSGSTASLVFQGSSLTLGDGTNTGTLALKGNSGETITTNSLFLNKGSVDSNANNAGANTITTITVGGTMTLQAGGGQFRGQSTSTTGTSDTRNLIVSASIGGAGGLTTVNYAGTPLGNATITLTSSSNSYQGGSTVQTNTLLDVQKDGGLGTGNVLVSTGGTLKLDSGTANSYINDAATLTIASGAIANLAYTGTDSVGGLVLNNVTEAPGVYNSSNSGGLLTGSGSITVVPEPVSLGLISVSGLSLLGRRRRA